MKSIRLGAMLSEVNMPNSVFNIEYRKADGNFGQKENCMLRNKDNISDRKQMNRTGVLKLWQPRTSKMFDVTIDLITKFNGMRVIRNYSEDV